MGSPSDHAQKLRNNCARTISSAGAPAHHHTQLQPKIPCRLKETAGGGVVLMFSNLRPMPGMPQTLTVNGELNGNMDMSVDDEEAQRSKLR